MGIFSFLHKHKNKILLVGGAAGVVVVVNKILASYEKQWQTSSSRGFVYEARKKEIHFENMINECNQICHRMYPKIINRLQDLLDDNQLIKDLSSKKLTTQEKVETWKSLKVKILTRLLSEIYCTCMLVCCMRVQMSVAGGQVFAKSAIAESSRPSSESVADLTHMKAYTKYVGLLGTFYDQRLDTLIQRIEEAVTEATKVHRYNLQYKISIQDFKEILDTIRRSISFFFSSSNSITKLLIYDTDELAKVDLSSVCPDSGPLTQAEDQMLRSMLAETQDILESDDFKHVLESSIEVAYAILLDTLLEAFIKADIKVSEEGDPSFSNPNTIKVPLARLLPQIRDSYAKRRKTNQTESLVDHLLCLDVLNCFAANVYEAFCTPSNNTK